GVFGYFDRAGYRTTPIFGYDTTRNADELPIYRALTWYLIQCSSETILHMSAGASEFKRCRGGEQQIEYHFVRPVGPFRRAFFRIVAHPMNGLVAWAMRRNKW
ncbi:MAG: GNAT family N-acetyltransferase, partial [Bacilli bacterium]